MQKTTRRKILKVINNISRFAFIGFGIMMLFTGFLFTQPITNTITTNENSYRLVSFIGGTFLFSIGILISLNQAELRSE